MPVQIKCFLTFSESTSLAYFTGPFCIPYKITTETITSSKKEPLLPIPFPAPVGRTVALSVQFAVVRLGMLQTSADHVCVSL